MGIRACAIIAFILSAALTGAILDQRVAHAQDGDDDHVDVALTLQFPDTLPGQLDHHLDIVVVNHGSRTAYDVEVVVDVEYPEDSSLFLSVPEVPAGKASIENDRYTLRWSIPALGGLQREEVTAKVYHKILAGHMIGTTFDNSLVPHEVFGEVTTSSFESELHKGNNTSRAWSYRYHLINAGYIQVEGNYSVAVSVDEPSPAPGGTVNFTITADRANPISELLGGSYLTPPPIDLEVAIDLTEGLSVSGAPTYSPNTAGGKPASVIYDNGVFNIGTRKMDDPQPPTYSVTLPVRVSNNAVVNEQCLTATLTGNPPPGTGPRDDDISDNVAKVCLGLPPDGEQVALRDGTVDLFTWYDCVGKTTAPCNENDSLELVTLTNTTNRRIHEPSQVVVHIPDREGRAISSESGSAALVWSTGVADFTGLPGSDRPGAVVAVNASLLNYKPTVNDPGNWGIDHPQWSNWHTGHIKVTAVVPTDNHGDPLGEIKGWRKKNPPDELFWGNDVDPSDGTNPTLLMDYDMYLGDSGQAVGGWREERYIEFSALGTYLLTVTTTVEYDDDGDDGTATVSYAETEKYTFHIGPMADLTVEDGGASSHIAANQHALSIVAVNNGPNYAGSAQVTGLPTEAEVLYKFPDSSNYDNATGVWDIGELKVRDYYHSRGEAEPTLIVSATAADTANVSIANSETRYEVCISSIRRTLPHTNHTDCKGDAATTNVWHAAVCVNTADHEVDSTITVAATCNDATDRTWTENVCASSNGDVRANRTETECNGWFQGTVYEYNAANNTATITARAGTGGVGVGIPTMQTPVILAPAVGLEWSEVKYLHSLPVKRYEIQWSTNGVSSWTQLETDLPLNALVDITIQSGITRFYRVRAVNEAGVPGPWSQPIIARTGTTSVPGAPTGVSASPDGDAAIDVSWTAPLDDGGTPITRYNVQWSPDGSSNWRTAGNTPDGQTLTFKNSGMTFGTTRYYRVAARNSRGLSAWSDPPYASATTLSGVPGQPRLTVRATDANTIALTWTKPADNGDPITRYEIQWSEDGSSGWTQLATPGPSDTSYDDAGLDPGTRRYYRLRARNGIGNGSWSRTVNALTPPAMPSAPTLYAASDGENAINLSWDPPADDGGADITGYELHASINSGVNYSRLTSLSATARSYVHRGLKPGDERYYQLRARNRAGWGEFSGSASAVTLTGVPTAPGLTARANGSTEIRLTWTDPDDRGSDITNYDLQQSDDGEDWHSLGGVIPADDLEYLHSGLSGGTRKYYRIRAVNGNGEGQWSATRNARTDAGGPDAPVLSLSVASDNQIDLTWTVPADNGSRIRGYWVERSVDGSAPWERLRSSGTSTTYSDDSLYRGMTRYYRVAATNSAGAGAYSNVASATTTGDPATAPSAPTFCRLSDVNRNQVSLAWDPPTDDGGAPVSGYEYRVTYPGVDGSTQRVEGTTSSTSARISGLTSDGSYLFRVRAVNPVGKGEWSSDILATLWPSLSGSVRVSPTTITVDEGDTVSYTIRLGTAPPHPVEVLISTQGFEGAADIEDAASAYSGRVLIPSGWTHPGDEDWSGFTHNWSRGVPVTFTAPEDSDNADDVTVIDHYVIAVPYDNYYPCQDAADVEKCSDDWDAAWTKSPYQSLTGASVKITVRDND